jgi:hypothetical protein
MAAHLSTVMPLIKALEAAASNSSMRTVGDPKCD